VYLGNFLEMCKLQHSVKSKDQISFPLIEDLSNDRAKKYVW